jgi:hypothetical protein
MRMQRRQSTIRAFLVLAMVLASLWAGGPAVSAGAKHTGQLADGASLPGIESAALPDRVPAVRPSAERSDPGGRVVSLLLGLVAVSLTVAFGVPARRRRSSLAPGRSLVQLTQLDARAPPSLQPA